MEIILLILSYESTFLCTVHVLYMYMYFRTCTFECTFVRNNKVVVQSTKVGPTLKVQRCILRKYESTKVRKYLRRYFRTFVKRTKVLRKYESTFESTFVLSYFRTKVLSYFRILLALQTVCTFITCTTIKLVHVHTKRTYYVVLSKVPSKVLSYLATYST
jgi:hypothetical protein